MKKSLIALTIFLVLAVYFFYPEKVVTYPAGVTAPDPPRQSELADGMEWTDGEYTFIALAEYSIKARVLSRNNFHLGRESDLSPFDLALGWGPMSDQTIIDQIDISQSSRWYHWHADILPIPASEVSLNSANTHIVPKDESVQDRFDEVYKGSLVEMKGYLVKITGADGWRWISSLKRNDTGGGSCELFWVEDITVFDN